MCCWYNSCSCCQNREKKGHSFPLSVCFSYQIWTPAAGAGTGCPSLSLCSSGCCRPLLGPLVMLHLSQLAQPVPASFLPFPDLLQLHSSAPLGRSCQNCSQDFKCTLSRIQAVPGGCALHQGGREEQTAPAFPSLGLG